jgi:pimeloyl-ACP methyl ester carboxylesterase
VTAVGYGRTDADFLSAGVRCAAWLYTPDVPAPQACVVMAHGFSATREDSLTPYAEAFAAAGLAVLVFDYRCFGDSDGEPRQQLDIGMQLGDWRAAVAHARGLERVDPTRIALWGSSFSGGHVLATAAADPAVAAVIAQAPYVDGPATVRIMNRRSLAMTGWAAVRDEAARLLGRPRVLVPVAGPPGSRAALTAPEVVPGFAAIVGPDTRWQNAFTAAALLRVPFYSPARTIGQVSAPLLMCICDRDGTVPPVAAARAAAKAPNARVVHYDVGHFEIYVGSANERAVHDQTAFLAEHLL